MVAGRAYVKGEAVKASKNIQTSRGVIPKDTPGRITHNSKATSATARVKFQGVGGAYRVVPKNCLRP